MGLRLCVTPLFDDSFHGRQTELAELEALCALPSLSVLTLLGPPGGGKTRLARELIQRLTRAGRRVIFCDLTAALRAEDVIAALERSVGWEPGRRSNLAELDSELALADLVVLDNAEHVVEPLRHTIVALNQCPMLVTSRTRLAVPGERVFELAYLPVEDEEGRSSPALSLFLERARRRNAAFASTIEEVRAAHDITRSLDGCPLALELAASRAGRASAEVLLTQLQKSGMAILTDREGGQLRFDSLRAALEGSWDLLDADEQHTLTTLALLQGPWTLETATALLALPAPDVFDRIEALRDRSLVQMDPDTPSRYRVYEIVREHALAHADEAARGKALDRLSEHLTQPRWGAMTFTEHHLPFAGAANLRVVFEGELRRGRPTQALQALLRLRRFYLFRGPHATYAELLAKVYSRVPQSSSVEGDDVLLGIAHAELSLWRGRFAEATAHAERTLEIVEARGGDPKTEALLLALLGNLQGALYAPERGLPLLESAQLRLPDDAPPTLKAYVLQQLATFLVLHDAEEAERRLERALLLVRPLGQPRHVVQVLAPLAICRIARGSREAAREALLEARAVGETDDERWLAVLELIDGTLCHEEERFEEAKMHYETAGAIFTDNGNPWLAGMTSLLLGDLSLETGDESACERSFAKALESLRPLGEHLTTAWSLAGLGALRARQGRRADSEKLFDEAMEIAQSVPLPLLRRTVALRRLELALAGDEEQVRGAAAQLREEREHCDHFAIRFPVRILTARLEAVCRATDKEMLEVQRDGLWFQLGGTDRVDLSRRKRLAGLLAHLARATGWVPFEDLFEAVWPGERCLPGSDVNRMNVTLSRLRSAGLGERVECDAGRFRITPAVHLTLHD